jgi:DivIVA domain-containing protein
VSTDSIQEKCFSRSLRGYSPKEVSAFLEGISAELAALREENAGLKIAMEKSESEKQASRELDARLKRMLDDMQKTSVRLAEQARTNAAAVATQAEQERLIFVKNAREEAALIIRDAETKSRRFVEDAERRRGEVLEEIGLLHARRRALIARMQALLTSQSEFLTSLDQDTKDPAERPSPMPLPRRTREGLDADDLRNIIDSLTQDE